MTEQDSVDTVEKAIRLFAREVYEGRAHLYIGRHLNNALIKHARIASVAKTFFALALHAHMVEAFLHLARLFDKRRSALKLTRLLDIADEHAGLFKNASPEQTRSLVESLRGRLESMEEKAKPVLKRRNELLAHLDPQAAFAPEIFEKEATITFGEMEGLYEQSGEIVNALYAAHSKQEVFMKILGVDDFQVLLRFAERGRQAEREEIERKWAQPSQGDSSKDL